MGIRQDIYRLLVILFARQEISRPYQASPWDELDIGVISIVEQIKINNNLFIGNLKLKMLKFTKQFQVILCFALGLFSVTV